MTPKKERVVSLTDREIKRLIYACECVVSDFCVGADEEEPFLALIEKLKGVMPNGSGKIL